MPNQRGPKPADDAAIDRAVTAARQQADRRSGEYRARALKMYPWICGRCRREFTHSNLSELTVHHRDHNHANNPEDGSNWELLCVYCHDNEHQRELESRRAGPAAVRPATLATGQPFSDLKALLRKDKPG